MDSTDIIRLIIAVVVVGGVLWICVPSIPPAAERKEPEMSDCPPTVMAYKDDIGRLHPTMAEARYANKEIRRRAVDSKMEVYLRENNSYGLMFSGELLQHICRHKTRIQQYYREIDELNNG